VPRNWFDLSGRVALVTGGSKGLGQSMARALAAQGADVAITSRTQADLEREAEEIRRLGGRVLPVAADVSEEESVRSMVGRVMEQFGQIVTQFASDRDVAAAQAAFVLAAEDAGYPQ